MKLFQTTFKLFFFLIFFLAHICLASPSSSSSSSSRIDDGDDQKFASSPSSSSNDGVEVQTFMPFKIGFEFQEGHHLCPWAKSRQDIQKKPLFFVRDTSSDRELWHVVIDGQDIEFVLAPFSRDEWGLLERAVESVMTACDCLKPGDFTQGDLEKALGNKTIKNLIGKGNFELKLSRALRESKNVNLKDSFEIWKNWLKGNEKYQTMEEQNFSKLWLSADHDAIPLATVFKLGCATLDPSLQFKDWVETLERQFSQELGIQKKSLFSSIEKKKIEISGKTLTFQPQATIQYPLEYSIPLFFGIFGGKQASKTPIVTALLRSLPLLDLADNINLSNEESSSSSNPLISGAHGELIPISSADLMEKYFKKETGLVFLHALTLSGVVSDNTCIINLLDSFFDRWNRVRQIDGKSFLYFMSRRPFSEMLKNIRSTIEIDVDSSDTSKNNGDEETNKSDNASSSSSSLPVEDKKDFANFYKESMLQNKFFRARFFQDNNWKEGKYPDYGEEFHEDLSSLISGNFFQESFITQWRATGRFAELEKSLKEGRLSVTMIRHFDPEKVKIIALDKSQKTLQDIFQNYCEEAVLSVVNSRKRYALTFENSTHPNFSDTSSSSSAEASKVSTPEKGEITNVSISELAHEYDMFSPLSFAKEDDAMGAIKGYEEIKEGEGIVEMRMIKDARFCPGTFLTEKDSLLTHARLLFNFLKNITKEKILSLNDVNDMLKYIKITK